jgi:hypothetical protein
MFTYVLYPKRNIRNGKEEKRESDKIQYKGGILRHEDVIFHSDV